MKLIALWLLVTGSLFGVIDASAQQPSDIWEYCTTNYSGAGQCFKSLGAAEGYMRLENPAGPSGRRFLELTRDPTFSGPLLSPTGITYGYSVKPRGPAAYLEDYIKSVSLGCGGNCGTGVICGCPNPDGTGTAQCLPYGSDTNCINTPGNCYGCRVSNADTGVLDAALIANLQKGNACNISHSLKTPWPSPPDEAQTFTINGTIFQGLAYSNAFQGSGYPPDPFNYEELWTYGTLSNGTCQNVQPRSTFGYSRNQHIQCDAGLYESGGLLNAQNYWPVNQVVSIDQICRSDETGSIVASLLPSGQCTYGDPCVPGNGSQIEDEVDYSFGSFILGRHYNSLRLATTNSYLGPSWQSDVDSRLAIPNSTSSTYVLLMDKKGNIERFDQQGTSSIYRSVNVPGSQLTPVTVSSVTTWQLRTSSAELWVFSSTGALLSTQVLNRPETLLTLTYGPVNSSDGTGTLLVPAGAVESVTDALGRTVTFNYAPINSGAICSGRDPACSGERLMSVALPDNSTITYSYDLSGNLSSVTYPDGNGRQYFYNEPTNICPSSLPGVCSGGSPPAEGFPHLLTGISDISTATGSPVATRFSTFQYDYRGRVVSSSQADGANQLTLSYPSPAQTILNFAYGNVAAGGMQKTINFTSIEGLFRKEASNQDADPITGKQFLTQFAYDSSGRLATRTDPLGYQHTYEYSNNLNLTATTDAVGQPSQRRVETDWSGTFNVPTERRIENINGANGIETRTRWAYNGRGQVSARCQVDPAINAASSYSCGSAANAPTGVRQWRYTYCEAVASGCPLMGLLLSIDGPRTDVSDVTSYSYYQTTDESGCATAGGACHHLGDIYQITNALGQATTYVSYDKNGRATRIQDANGTYTDMTYHARGWLLTRTVRGNANGTPNSTLDVTTTFAYDNTGNVSRVTQPDGTYLAYTYDAAHRLTTIKDNLGNSINYTLDAAGNRTRETHTDPSNNLHYAMNSAYDQLNRLIGILNNSNAAKQTYQNPAEAPPPGITYNDGYDGNGNAVYSVDGNGVGAEQQYDPLNRLVKTLQDHAGTGATHDTTTQYSYDTRSNLRSVTDPDNLGTNYTYDGLNNLTALQSPDTGNTGYTYDAAGNRKTQTDARGITSTYSYDALNRLTGITYPTSSLNVTYAYDQSATGCYNVGRLTSMSDGSGSTTYCYDRRGNVTTKTQSAKTNWALSGNGGVATASSTHAGAYPVTSVNDGDRTGVTWGNGGGWNDATSALFPDYVTITFPAAKAINSVVVYSLQDNYAQGVEPTDAMTFTQYGMTAFDVQTLSGSTWVTAASVTGNTLVKRNVGFTATTTTAIRIVCNAAVGNQWSRIIEIEAWGTAATNPTLTTGYTYTLADRLASVTYPSGAIVNYGRDSAGRVNFASHKANAGASAVTILSSIGYNAFGPAAKYTFGNGRILTKAYHTDNSFFYVSSSAANGLKIYYNPDVLGNVKDASTASGLNPPTASYKYDPLYRQTETDLGATIAETYTYGLTGDRLSKMPQGQSAQTYAYTPGTHHLASVAGVTRSYDLDGNTKQIGSANFAYDNRNRLSSAPGGSYSYNGRGERVAKINKQYAYDESGRMLGEYTAAGSVGGEFIYVDGTLVGYYRLGILNYVETDELGTPRLVIQPGATTANDTVVWKWDYFASNSAFGENTPSVQTVTFNLRFPGQYFDAETGLNYNYFRDYEPGTGRYVESDPINLYGGISTYGYVDESPLVYRDSLGLAGSPPRLPNPRPRNFTPPPPEPPKPGDFPVPGPELPNGPTVCTLANLFVTICPPVLKCVAWNCAPDPDPLQPCKANDPPPGPYIFMHGPDWNPEKDPKCKCIRKQYVDA